MNRLRLSACMCISGLIIVAANTSLLPVTTASDQSDAVRIEVIDDKSTGDSKALRKMVSGPGNNEHPKYPGCTGFIGWESVTRLGRNRRHPDDVE